MADNPLQARKEEIVAGILVDYPGDATLAHTLRMSTVMVAGDPKLQRQNSIGWVRKRTAVQEGELQMMIVEGTRMRYLLSERTATITATLYLRDDQYQELYFIAPSAWAQFARHSNPDRSQAVPDGNIDGWKYISVQFPNDPLHRWQDPKLFYRASKKRKAQLAPAAQPSIEAVASLPIVELPVAQLSIEVALPIVELPVAQPSIEAAIAPLLIPESSVAQPSIEAALPVPESPESKHRKASASGHKAKRRKKKLNIYSGEYDAHMLETQHARYQEIKSEDVWRQFHELHNGDRCAICLVQLRRFNAGSLVIERMHCIAQKWGSPERCSYDNLMIGCTVCNGRKEGMESRNLLAFVLEREGPDRFIVLCKQLFLWHIGNLTVKQLSGWTPNDLLDCYDYIRVRFVRAPHGWTEEERRRATAVMDHELRNAGLLKQLHELWVDKATVDKAQQGMSAEQAELDKARAALDTAQQEFNNKKAALDKAGRDVDESIAHVTAQLSKPSDI